MTASILNLRIIIRNFIIILIQISFIFSQNINVNNSV